jgi:hypothetical protein
MESREFSITLPKKGRGQEAEEEDAERIKK